MKTVECIIPILRVANLQASRRFYVDKLGFKIDWGKEPADKVSSVSRDGASIMLCEGEQGNPGTWVWIGVEDIKPLYEQLKSAGVKIVQEPMNFSWAYEFRIADPDGHVLRFGSDSLKGEPFQDERA